MTAKAQMLIRQIIAGMILTLLVTSGAQAQNKRDWQSGKLTSIDSQSAGTATAPIGGLVVSRNLEITVYKIETDTMIYQVRQPGLRPKPLNVTLNAPIKFAFDKSSMNGWILDDAAKEQKVILLQKTAK